MQATQLTSRQPRHKRKALSRPADSRATNARHSVGQPTAAPQTQATQLTSQQPRHKRKALSWPADSRATNARHSVGQPTAALPHDPRTVPPHVPQLHKVSPSGRPQLAICKASRTDGGDLPMQTFIHIFVRLKKPRSQGRRFPGSNPERAGFIPNHKQTEFTLPAASAVCILTQWLPAFNTVTSIQQIKALH
jgi:hypothetical protein